MTSDLDAAAIKLHDDSITMEMTCPLLNDPLYWHWWIEGGITVAAPSVDAFDGIRSSFRALAEWIAHVRRHPDKFILVTTVEDIFRAKRENKLGIIFHFQNTLPFERDLNLLEAYYRLGVRIIQLAYNERNHVGTGCEDRTDDGLSNFGIAAVQEMNRLGIVVDCSHTGFRTTRDALELSTRPVVISHANARVVCDNDRNLPDDMIQAVAAQGGLMGLNGFPAFVKRGVDHPTVDDLVAHCDHICQVTGSADHVAVAIDYYFNTADAVRDPELARQHYNEFVAAGRWNPRNYPPPPHKFPKGIDNPSKLRNLTVALKRRGYSDEDVRKIWGGNWIRVLKAHGM